MSNTNVVTKSCYLFFLNTIEIFGIIWSVIRVSCSNHVELFFFLSPPLRHVWVWGFPLHGRLQLRAGCKARSICWKEEEEVRRISIDGYAPTRVDICVSVRGLIRSPLGLDQPILKGVLAKGYKVPTPIQRKVIPILNQGVDVVAMARTGSGELSPSLPLLSGFWTYRKKGKTASFLVPLFQRLKSHSARVSSSFRSWSSGQLILPIDLYRWVWEPWFYLLPESWHFKPWSSPWIWVDSLIFGRALLLEVILWTHNLLICPETPICEFLRGYGLMHW